MSVSITITTTTTTTTTITSTTTTTTIEYGEMSLLNQMALYIILLLPEWRNTIHFPD